MRILVLHGYGGNAAWQWMNNWRLERLVWPLGVKFAYISGPVVLPGHGDGRLEGHSWQQPDGDWSESMRVLEEELQNGDFVGLLGHSQGASCIAMAAERMSAGTFPAGGVRFLILANGYAETDGAARARIRLPSLHIMDAGEAGLGLELAARFEGAATVEHWGGHRLEINTKVARALLDFLGPYATAERRSAVEELRVGEAALCRRRDCTEWGPGKKPEWWWCDWCWSRWEEDRGVGSLCDMCGQRLLFHSSAPGRGEHDGCWLCGACCAADASVARHGLKDRGSRSWSWAASRDSRSWCDMCGQRHDPLWGAPGRGAHEGRWFCRGCWGDWG